MGHFAPLDWPRCFNILAGVSLDSNDRHQTRFGEGFLTSCLVNTPTSFEGILAFRTINRCVYYSARDLNVLPIPWSLAAHVFKNSMNGFRLLAGHKNCDVRRCIIQVHRACRALRTVFIMARTEMQSVHDVEHDYIIHVIKELIRRVGYWSHDSNGRKATSSLKRLVLSTRFFLISSRGIHYSLGLRTIAEPETVELPAYTAKYISAFEGFANEVYGLGAIMDVLPQDTFAMHAPFSAETIRQFSNSYSQQIPILSWDSIDSLSWFWSMNALSSISPAATTAS